MIAALIVATTLGQSCYSRTYSGYNGYGYGYNSGYKTYNYGYNNGYVDRLLFVPLAPAYTQAATVTTAAQTTTTASAPAACPPADDRIDRLEASVMKLTDAVATLASRPAQEPPSVTAPQVVDDGPIMAGRRRRSAPPTPPALPPATNPAAATTPAAPYHVSLRPETAAALATNCAKCHTGQTARQFRIFDAPGTFAPLDLEGLAAIADAVESGRMPKHAPMTEADRAVVVGDVRKILAATGQ